MESIQFNFIYFNTIKKGFAVAPCNDNLREAFLQKTIQSILIKTLSCYPWSFSEQRQLILEMFITCCYPNLIKFHISTMQSFKSYLFHYSLQVKSKICFPLCALSPVHTCTSCECECDTNVDVTNSQRNSH